MSDPKTSDTICAVATPAGGAIGIVRLSGPQALSMASAVFSKDLTLAPSHTLHHGSISDKDTSETVDEALASVFRAPHSYTGEDSAEFACHGSPYVLRRTAELLMKAGARLAEPGEFTRRAFLNGKMDLSQAEAVADLIAADSQAAHRLAISQLKGAFSSQLATLRSQLLELTSLLELELDFSDQDVQFADRASISSLCAQAEEHITRLVESFATGNALRNGVPVAIVGAPNVGKSTLLNALLRDERAIVSPLAGTTRDTVEDVAVIEGIPFRFIDTAGIRHTADSLENLGIERALKAAASARIVIAMSEPGVPEPQGLAPREGQTVIHIVNKTPSFRAIDGTGVDELRRKLAESVPLPQEGDTLVTNLRHHEALTRALSSLRRAADALRRQVPSDLVALDLRQCLHSLGEITGGEITGEEVLANIFSRFCIGK